MAKRKSHFFLTILFMIVLGCNANNAGNKKDNSDISNKQSAGTPEIECFSLPQIPVMLANETDRANYLVMHWWDHFAFTNMDCIKRTKIGEQAFVDFIDLLRLVNDEQSKQAIIHLMSQTTQEETSAMYRYFFNLAEKYLYDPNSPFRNEEHYACFLEYILKDKGLSSEETIRPTAQLKDINKNRRGTIANDFNYVSSDGKRYSLHGIKADYTLIYFNNPDCHDCKRMLKELKQSAVIDSFINNGKLKLLSLYVDEDLTVWKQHQHETPSHWINAYDGTPGFSIQKQLYTIRAIPSLYLLDKDKKVILKDVDVQDVEKWLKAL